VPRSCHAKEPRPRSCAILLAALPLAHVRWFAPDPNRGLERSAICSGVTLLALAAIAATLGGAWLAQRLVTRLRLAARARVLAGPLLERWELGLPRPADLYPWIAAVLALHTAAILFVRGVERQLFTPNLALPYTLAGGGRALLAIVVAFTLVAGIAVGPLTRPAAVGLALLGVLGMVYFGPLLVLEQTSPYDAPPRAAVELAGSRLLDSGMQASLPGRSVGCGAGREQQRGGAAWGRSPARGQQYCVASSGARCSME